MDHHEDHGGFGMEVIWARKIHIYEVNKNTNAPLPHDYQRVY